jgi:hypothetical protein
VHWRKEVKTRAAQPGLQIKPMNLLESKSFKTARPIEPLMIHDYGPAKPFDAKSICLKSV